MYVPMLKGRAGEFGALQTLPDHVRAELSPVLEVVRSKYSCGFPMVET